MPLTGGADFTVEIKATPLDCFNVITDFPCYPKWSSAIERVRVLEQDSAGIARVVEFHLDMRVKRIRYVLQYRYRKPTSLTWHSIGGDVEAIEGAYKFRKLSPKLTEVTCHQAVQLGFWIPAALRTLAESKALRQSVLEFKAEVERKN